MADFLLGAAMVILLIVSVGLIRILRGPADVDRLMAAELIGTGGIALLLLAGVATAQPAVIDVALTLALLAAFAGLAFVRASSGPGGGGGGSGST
jgi:multicomponent Na+:H+ antiporter subunit F